MKNIPYGLCWLLEHLCCLTHPFGAIEYKLTRRHCNLTLLAIWLNDKFNLGYWEEVKE